MLTQLAARKNDLFRVDVAPGASLVATVVGALAEIGRAFGAARVVELARTGRYRADGSTRPGSRPTPSRAGTRAERSLAPPLVVHVDGGDLRAEGLATCSTARRRSSSSCAATRRPRRSRAS